MTRWLRWTELALGVIPITIVGGLYGVLGLYFGVVSIAVSLSQHSLSLSPFWLVILGLAIGGLVGIAGLWMLMATSEGGGTRQARAIALGASGVGVVTALAALTLAIRDGNLRWSTAYLLVAPTIVAIHRAYRQLTPPERRSGE